MTNRKNLLLGALAATASFGVTAQALASDTGGVEFENEVRSCVAAVANHADYRGATRVQHNVVTVKRAPLGYALKIDTAVFADPGDAAIREYATFCVANGDYKPLRFRIREIDSGA